MANNPYAQQLMAMLLGKAQRRGGTQPMALPPQGQSMSTGQPTLARPPIISTGAPVMLPPGAMVGQMGVAPPPELSISGGYLYRPDAVMPGDTAYFASDRPEDEQPFQMADVQRPTRPDLARYTRSFIPAPTMTYPDVPIRRVAGEEKAKGKQALMAGILGALLGGGQGAMGAMQGVQQGMDQRFDREAQAEAQRYQNAMMRAQRDYQIALNAHKSQVEQEDANQDAVDRANRDKINIYDDDVRMYNSDRSLGGRLYTTNLNNKTRADIFKAGDATKRRIAEDKLEVDIDQFGRRLPLEERRTKATETTANAMAGLTNARTNEVPIASRLAQEKLTYNNLFEFARIRQGDTREARMAAHELWQRQNGNIQTLIDREKLALEQSKRDGKGGKGDMTPAQIEAVKEDLAKSAKVIADMRNPGAAPDFRKDREAYEEWLERGKAGKTSSDAYRDLMDARAEMIGYVFNAKTGQYGPKPVAQPQVKGAPNGYDQAMRGGYSNTGLAGTAPVLIPNNSAGVRQIPAVPSPAPSIPAVNNRLKSFNPSASPAPSRPAPKSSAGRAKGKRDMSKLSDAELAKILVGG